MIEYQTYPLIDRHMLLTLIDLIRAEKATIRTAQFSACLPTPQAHHNYKVLWQELIAAGNRGIEAQMLLAQPSPRSPQCAESAAAAIDLNHAHWTTRWLPAGRLAHMKIWIFGDHTIIIGSHNLTHAAMMTNTEASLLTRDQVSIDHIDKWWRDTWLLGTPRPTIGIA